VYLVTIRQRSTTIAGRRRRAAGQFGRSSGIGSGGLFSHPKPSSRPRTLILYVASHALHYFSHRNPVGWPRFKPSCSPTIHLCDEAPVQDIRAEASSWRPVSPSAVVPDFLNFRQSIALFRLTFRFGPYNIRFGTIRRLTWQIWTGSVIITFLS